MIKFLQQIWDPFQDLIAEIYHAKKKSSDGGENVTASEGEAILEKGRILFLAIEGAVKELRR
jgi:hypothetical protein